MSQRTNLQSWEEDYLKNHIPWDSLESTNTLTRLLDFYLKPKNKVLEIGCGTGKDS